MKNSSILISENRHTRAERRLSDFKATHQYFGEMIASVANKTNAAASEILTVLTNVLKAWIFKQYVATVSLEAIGASKVAPRFRCHMVA